LPADGSLKGNITLMREIRSALGDLNNDEYWAVQRELVNSDQVIQGRGQGGSLRMRAAVPVSSLVTEPAQREADLYPGVHDYIRKSFAEEQRLTDFVSEITANTRRGSGLWTCPDLVLVGLRTFSYLLARRVEVITFEVKRQDSVTVAAAYEASAHRAAAHRSYVVAESTSGSDLDERLVSECERLGVGISSFAEATDLESYEIYLNGQMNAPDLDNVD
jgi:hypothetical protein